MMKFSAEAIESFTDKDSKVDKFRELYEHNDFLTAYSMHTDLRVNDNPRGAIGREDEWETHGVLQRDFLIRQGLKPEHRFLDLGCGTGRLARKVVPYLQEGHYTGADISPAALRHAEKMSINEQWQDRCPYFVQIDGTPNALKIRDPFDMIWAHSVFTHLPPEAIEALLAGLNDLMTDSGKFLFTYKSWKTPERTGLKQWRYPFAFFDETVKRHGFKATPLSMIWPASQHTGLIVRAA